MTIPPPIRLVGRDDERAQLRAALGRAMDGVGGLALVSGEAGIGKTTLVEGLKAEAGRWGVRVLSGGCYDLTTTPPYAPWIEALRGFEHAPDESLPPAWADVSSLIEPPGSQSSFLEELRGVLADVVKRKPLLVVLEDLHWADSESLDVLRYLGRHAATDGVLIVATYRDDEVTRTHSLFHILPLLVRESHPVRLELQRLSQADVRLMVAEWDLGKDGWERLTQYLYRRADGNPFFTHEVLHSLVSENAIRTDRSGAEIGDLDVVRIPAIVLQVIEQRLSRLDGETRRALQVASVIGQEVSFDLWVSIGALGDALLDRVIEQAIDAHIMRETASNQGLVFRHALIREVLYVGVVPTRRRGLHREVGELLAGTSNPNPAEVAHHFQQAGDERAIAWHVRAGLRASGSAWFSAAQQFEMAAMLLEGNERRDRERGWLRLAAGSLLRWSGDPRAIQYVEQAERLGLTTGDKELAAYACGVHGAQLCIRGDVRQGILEMQRSVNAVDSLQETDRLPFSDLEGLSDVRWMFAGFEDSKRDPRVTASTPIVALQKGPLTNWLSMSGRYREAVSVGEAYVADVEKAFSADRRPRAVVHSGYIGVADAYAALGRPDAAGRAYQLGRASSLAFGDFVMAEFSIWSELLMSGIPYRTDQLPERSQQVADASHFWERCRGLTITTGGDGAPTELQADFLEGRWQKARELATDHLGGPLLNHMQKAIVTLGCLDRYQGQPSRAWERVRQLLPQGPATEPGNCFFAHAIEAIALAAELALDVNEMKLAEEWIESHEHWLEWSGATLWQPHHNLLQSRYCQLAGNFDNARRFAESSLEYASHPRQPLVLIAIHRQRGELATGEKHVAGAEAHLPKSLALAEACAAPFERALTLLALAELGAATGRRDEALLHLDEARAICVPLAARPALERIKTIEHQITMQPSSLRTHGLSSRETEVLELIAARHSNREIAEALFLSPRTVERHIANIYLKIDVHSRTEAIEFARRHRTG